MIDQLAEVNRGDWQLKGWFDLGRIGVAGHTYGGQAALALAGQTLRVADGSECSLRDPRVKAVITMSVAPRMGDAAALDVIYGSIRVPCLHMMGGRDDSPLGDIKTADRRIPFDRTAGADRYRMGLNGADLMIFTDVPGRDEPGSKLPRQHAVILACSTAFWDAHLKGDAEAGKWLADGGFADFLGKDGTFEKKAADGPSR